MPAQLRIVREGEPDFEQVLAALARRGETDLERVEQSVRAILAEVRRGGDQAVRAYVEKFEQRQVTQLLKRDYGGKAALEALPREVAQALTFAAERIKRYHAEQAKQQRSFEYQNDGVLLSSRVTPLQRVGVYAPGGKASYPSTVLMCAVPASVAGVRDIIVACPDTTPEVLAACHLAGVHGILDAGGAQAIAALAYGTSSVPKVDKIVGPGNIYVAAAKRLVFGEVSIDSIAGPSEILVIADETANAEFVAADLLSQAEHDEAAYPLLLTDSAALLSALEAALARQLAALPEHDEHGRPRRALAEASVRNNGHALLVKDRNALARVANLLAAEHVSVQTREPRDLTDRIERAGAIFIGQHTPEAAGDYVAGPSHVLPTGGAARFAAPLGVYDFVSRSSLIGYELSALKAHGSHITSLARREGLEAHARAVEIRTKSS